VRQAKDEGESWEPASASAVKKAKKLYAQHQTKLARQEELKKKDELEGAAKRAAEAKKLEDAKAVVLEEPTTPATKIKIKQAVEKRGERVRIFGWVHRLRQQGAMIFIVLRDGTGFLQCVLTGKLVSSPRPRLAARRGDGKADLFLIFEQPQTFDALTLTLESSIQITGTINELPEGKTAVDNHELSADWFSVVGKAPGGDDAFLNKVSEVSWNAIDGMGSES